MITTVLNAKISEIENKIPDASRLVTTNVLNTNIREVDIKYITTEYLQTVNILLLKNLIN